MTSRFRPSWGCRALLGVVLLVPLLAAAAPPKVEDTVLPDRSVGALKVGMRVVLTRHDGAIEPAVSGHLRRVACGPGQTGTIKRFVRRKMTFDWSPRPSEFTVAIVRFDAQSWREWDTALNQMKEGVAYTAEDIDRMNKEQGAEVKLKAFEAPIHLELLGPAPRKR